LNEFFATMSAPAIVKSSLHRYENIACVYGTMVVVAFMRGFKYPLNISPVL